MARHWKSLYLIMHHCKGSHQAVSAIECNPDFGVAQCRHKACPYGRFEGVRERVARKGGRQARGLPLPEIWVGDGGGAAYGSGRAGRGLVLAEIEGERGQAQGLPLPEIWVGAEETARTGVGGQAEGWS